MVADVFFCWCLCLCVVLARHCCCCCGWEGLRCAQGSRRSSGPGAARTADLLPPLLRVLDRTGARTRSLAPQRHWPRLPRAGQLPPPPGSGAALGVRVVDSWCCEGGGAPAQSALAMLSLLLRPCGYGRVGRKMDERHKERQEKVVTVLGVVAWGCGGLCMRKKRDVGPRHGRIPSARRVAQEHCNPNSST